MTENTLNSALEAPQSKKRVWVVLLLSFLIVVFIGVVSATYPAYLQDNIVSCWTFDETSGTNVIDYGLGQQNNGTTVAGMARGADSQSANLGSAYYFNSTDVNTYNVLMTPVGSSLNNTAGQNRTFIIVFNTTDSEADIGGGKINNWGYQLGISGSVLSTKPFMANGTNGDFSQGTTNVVTGNNVLGIFHYDASTDTAYLYVNGSLEKTMTGVSDISNNNQYGFGYSSILGAYTGYISEAALLNASDANTTAFNLIYNSGNIESCVTAPAMVAPSLNLTYPINNSIIMTNSTNLTVNSTAGTYDLANVTYYVWFNNNTLFNQTTVNISGSGSNVSDLIVYNFLDDNTYLFGAVTCQGNGNGTNCTTNTNNITFQTKKLYYYWNNFTTSVLEQSSNIFYANFSVRSGFSVSSINLTYNQTNYSASFTSINSTAYNASVTVIAPIVNTNTNITFNWTVFLTDSSTNFTSSNNQQTVTNFGIDNCSTNTIQIFNFSLVNEATQVNLDAAADNSSIKIDLSLYPNGTKMVTSGTFSKLYTEVLPARVCVNSSLASTNYFVDVQVQYDADGYANEFYNIQNYSLNATSNPSENITLYDLSDTNSQVYTITYKDSSFLPVADALIQIQRKYIDEGEFKVVEIPITDDSGRTLAHLVTDDVVYTFTVVKNGELLATFTNQQAVCQNPSITDCIINLNSFLSSIDVSDFEDTLDFSYTLGYNASSRTVSTTFSIPSGAVSWVTLNITQEDALGSSVCNTGVTTSAGTLNCVLGSSFGNSTVMASIYKGGTLVAKGQIKLDQDPSDIYGGALVVLALFIMLTFIGASLSDNPIYTVVFFMVGVILLYALNLVANNGFIGSTATILWFIVAIAIVIIKGANRS